MDEEAEQIGSINIHLLPVLVRGLLLIFENFSTVGLK